MQVAMYSFWSILIGGGLYVVYLCNLTSQAGGLNADAFGAPTVRRNRGGGQPRYIGVALNAYEETATIHDSDTIPAFSADMSGLEGSRYSSIVATHQDSDDLSVIRDGTSDREMMLSQQESYGVRDDGVVSYAIAHMPDSTERAIEFRSDSQSSHGSESPVLTASTEGGEVTLLPRFQADHHPMQSSVVGSEAQQEGRENLELSQNEYKDHEDSHADSGNDSIGVDLHGDSDDVNDSIGFDGPSGVRRRPRRQPTPPGPSQQQQRSEQPVFIGII